MGTEAGDMANRITNTLEGVKERWPLFIIFGIITMILGAIAIILPHAATFAIDVLIGWVLIFGGIAQFIYAVTSHKAGGTGFKIIWSIIYLIVGVLLLVYPLQGVVSLTALLIALFILGGIFKIVVSIQNKMVGWGWLLWAGIVAVILGMVIWMGWPGDSGWVLGLLVGIDLIFAGIWMIAFGTGVRKLKIG